VPFLENNSGQPSKKLLENPVIGSLVVPIAIVLIGALIVFGVTRMISTDQSYKDLVREMQSKKFGNRWVAAYELSKLISTKSIPEEDVPWLINELQSLFTTSTDARAKEFLIVAAGAMRRQESLPLLMLGLIESDSKVLFHSIVALGNMPKDVSVDWTKVTPFLDSKDQTLQMAAMLSLSTHKVANAGDKIKKHLGSGDQSLKYTAATALIHYRDAAALPVLNEIANLKNVDATQNFDPNQIKQLKLNIIFAMEREKWPELGVVINKIADQEDDKEIVTKARNVLNKLKI
jgi:hypothetical protein